MKFTLVACAVNLAVAFNPNGARFGQQATLSKTRVFEDFNLDFKNPNIITSKEIFTEKQYREFISTYSVDERINPLEFIAGLLPKFGEGKSKIPDETSKAAPNFAKQLKPSVSLAVLEEKTASYVKGSINGKAYLNILKAAFGDNLSTVLPEIVSSLPPSKADELSKAK